MIYDNISISFIFVLFETSIWSRSRATYLKTLQDAVKVAEAVGNFPYRSFTVILGWTLLHQDCRHPFHGLLHLLVLLALGPLPLQSTSKRPLDCASISWSVAWVARRQVTCSTRSHCDLWEAVAVLLNPFTWCVRVLSRFATRFAGIGILIYFDEYITFAYSLWVSSLQISASYENNVLLHLHILGPLPFFPSEAHSIS